MLFISSSGYYDALATQALMGLGFAINTFSVSTGEGPATCTSYRRPKLPGSESLHEEEPMPLAWDLRTNDKPAWWIVGVILICRAFKGKYDKLQYDLHPELAGTPRAHIHFEWDDGGEE